MNDNRFGDPRKQSTYNGFAHARSPPPSPRRSLSRRMLMAGLAGAVALGVGLGLVARPALGPEPTAAPPAVAARPSAFSIELAAPAPPPQPQSVGKLEVLPADMAQAAEAQAKAVPTRPSLIERLFAPAPRKPEPVAPPPHAFQPPEPPRAVALARPSFNCRFARTPSEQIVCGDPGIARLDRRMSEAFERAVQSGIPFQDLRAEQDDWLAIREDAARHSPDAVASVYRQRIRELDELASEPFG